MTSLWRLARYENGYAFKAEHFTDDGLPVIRIRQLVDVEAEVDYSNAPIPVRYRIDDGDIIFSWSGSLAVRTWDRGPAWLNQHLFRVVPETGIDRAWLRWLCEASIPVLMGLMHGSAMTHLTLDMLKQIRITVPPPEEQRRIADFLDAETARIDGLLTKREQQLGTLAERVDALISEALIPGILTAPANRPPWPWLPEPIHDRPLTKLGYVSRLQNGLTVDGQRHVEGDVVTRPYLRVANVQAGKLDLETVSEITVSRRVADRSTLRPGDVLMTEGGDLDKLGRGTVWRDEIPGCLHQNHVFAIRPNHDRLVPEFLAYMTQTVHGRCYFESTGSRTTNLASTNSYKIMAFPIPLPPIDAQRKTVNDLQAAVEHSERTRALIEQQRSLLRERRQALITAAVTGQFDVATASGQGTTE
jgi:type I restriction enzyme, S subunit